MNPMVRKESSICRRSSGRRKSRTRDEELGTDRQNLLEVEETCRENWENEFSSLNDSDLMLAELDEHLIASGSESLKTFSPSLKKHRLTQKYNQELIFSRENICCLKQEVSEELGMKSDCRLKTIQTKYLLAHDRQHVLEENDLFDDSDCFVDEPALSSLIAVEEVVKQSDSCSKSADVDVKLKSPDIITRTPNSRKQPSAIREPANVSLKDRLKRKLHQNSSIVTPSRDKLQKDIKDKAVLQARIEASQLRKEGSDVDIGPFYGLPSKVQQLYNQSRGISKLYNWQDECLKLPALKNRKNLILTLPTSGGKTLVAEILTMKELLCHHRDAILVLPFVSIVQEKVRTISEFAVDLGFLVEEYAGSKGRFPPIKRREKNSLYIATIEKAHSLVNSLIETGRMESLGLIIVDEMHMIGEGGSRGATLETMLLKVVNLECQTQIVGMSATLNNIKDLQDFLFSEVYNNNFRPVKLEEFVKVEDNLFRINHEAVDFEWKLEHEKMISFPGVTEEMLKQDPDNLLGLVLEVLPDNSCLIFCQTKKNCENVALMLAKLMYKYRRHLSEIKKMERKILHTELQKDNDGSICPVLARTIQFGLAYHHSGLTLDERRLIEEAYSSGTLRLLACTSTLAAGVNLPAKRVILRSPFIGANLLKNSQYKQMVGRAGRAGIDSSGESILVIKYKDRAKVKELFEGPKDCCHSSLAYEDGKGVRSLLLSAMGLKIVTSTESAHQFMARSLLSIQSTLLAIDVQEMTERALKFLHENKLIECDQTMELSTTQLRITALGRATFKGSVDHIYSNQLYKDLKKAEESLNLSTHLHLLFLVTPYDTAAAVVPDWKIYYDKYCELSEVEAKVASVIGVPESYLGVRSCGQSSRKKVCLLTVSRFYLTLMLWDLWNGKSVWLVAEVFSQTRGFVQNLLSQSSAFASSVYHFCQELTEFWAYQELLGSFVKRLTYCVSAELIPLMEVPGVKLARAKQLQSAGFTNLAKLAAANEEVLIRSVEHLSRKSAHQIIAAAKNLIEEKVAALMDTKDAMMSVEENVQSL